MRRRTKALLGTGILGGLGYTGYRKRRYLRGLGADLKSATKAGMKIADTAAAGGVGRRGTLRAGWTGGKVSFKALRLLRRVI